MFKKNTYCERRASLKNNLKSGLLLFVGNAEIAYNYKSNTYKFRQDSTFLYLFGLDLPNLVALIDIDKNEEVIFGNDADIEDIIWTGPLASIHELANSVGVNKSLPLSNLECYIKGAIDKGRPIHFLAPYRNETLLLLAELLGKSIQEIPEMKSVELIKALVELRSVKEPQEIQQIEFMLDVAREMHLTAMTMAKSGNREREIASKIEGICLTKAFAPSFPVICSVRGEVLHNTTYNNVLQKGQLLLCDSGAESFEHYASDITRTSPIDGEFASFQKNIFDIVLAANRKVQELAMPGVFYRDVHLQAAKVIASGLKSLGLMKGDVDEIVQKGAHALFFPHGVGHMLGLDVHDMENYGENFVGYDESIQRSSQFGLAFLRMGRKLQEGFVVTDEPGIYFIPELIQLWENENKFPEHINYAEAKKHLKFGGIRIEDDLLITKSGCKVLGKPIPYTL